MRVGDRCNVECIDLNIGENIVHWCHEIKYLGLFFQQASYVKINVHSCKVKFFRSFNSIYAKLGSSSSVDTLVKLMKTNCLSVLLHNLECVNLTKTNLSNLSFPLNRSFIKIFNVSDIKSVTWCQYYMGQLPVEFILDIRKRKFYKKLSVSDCPLLQQFFSGAAAGLLKQINLKYNVTCNLSVNAFAHCVWEKFLQNLNL
jgi:hypothetical protein